MTLMLHTDKYQLTMAASYLDNGVAFDESTFDLFFRKYPRDQDGFEWKYIVLSGIEDALHYIETVGFDEMDVEALVEWDILDAEHANQLLDLDFNVTVRTIREGSIVGPNMPVMSVTGPRIECQLMESMLLHLINYQSMVATQARQCVDAARGKGIAEFGMRRAPNATAASKAAYIGGCIGTSNVLTSVANNIPCIGTMAHSFVTSFEDEIAAFRAFAKTYGKESVYLVDTYDTITGVKNAIEVAKEVGGMKGIRLDSGDLIELANQARQLLDEAGFEDAQIIASDGIEPNTLRYIESMTDSIDAYGVGTNMVNGPAMSGVYKLVQDESGPAMKLAPGKMNLPGLKNVFTKDGSYRVALEGEEMRKGWDYSLLPRIVDGERVVGHQGYDKIREYSLNQPLPQKQVVVEHSTGVLDLQNRLEKELTEQ